MNQLGLNQNQSTTSASASSSSTSRFRRFFRKHKDEYPALWTYQFNARLRETIMIALLTLYCGYMSNYSYNSITQHFKNKASNVQLKKQAGEYNILATQLSSLIDTLNINALAEIVAENSKQNRNTKEILAKITSMHLEIDKTEQFSEKLNSIIPTLLENSLLSETDKNTIIKSQSELEAAFILIKCTMHYEELRLNVYHAIQETSSAKSDMLPVSVRFKELRDQMKNAQNFVKNTLDKIQSLDRSRISPNLLRQIEDMESSLQCDLSTLLPSYVKYLNSCLVFLDSVEHYELGFSAFVKEDFPTAKAELSTAIIKVSSAISIMRSIPKPESDGSKSFLSSPDLTILNAMEKLQRELIDLRMQIESGDTTPKNEQKDAPSSHDEVFPPWAEIPS
ncbi:MAG: hypothetical protein ABIH99_04720 [Candidatus Micrarchaeota archaeon]